MNSVFNAKLHQMHQGKNLKIVFKIEIPALRSIIYSLRNEGYEKPNHGLIEKSLWGCENRIFRL